MTMTGFRQMTRTTMVVKLHPGQTKRLSAYLEDDEKRTEISNLEEEVRQSICGLEISFSSLPQDIDIKLIPAEDLE